MPVKAGQEKPPFIEPTAEPIGFVCHTEPVLLEASPKDSKIINLSNEGHEACTINV